jgi:tetratricopeptide (TPR) repeat protein
MHSVTARVIGCILAMATASAADSLPSSTNLFSEAATLAETLPSPAPVLAAIAYDQAQAGQTEQATRTLARARKLLGTSREPAVLVLIASTQARLHGPEAMEQTLRAATGPDTTAAWLTLARTYADAGKKGDALRALDQARAAAYLSDSWGRVHTLMMTADAANRVAEVERSHSLLLEAAVLAQSEALGSAINHLDLLLSLGGALRAAGLAKEGEATLARAEAAAADNPNAFTLERVGRAYRVAGIQAGLGRVLEAAEKLLEPDASERSVMALSVLFARLGDVPRALKLARSLEQSDLKASALIRAGEAEYRTGRLQQALAIAAEAIPVARSIERTDYQSRDGALLQIAALQVEAGSVTAGLEALAEARKAIEESVAGRPEPQRPMGLAMALVRVAAVEAQAGKKLAALATLARADEAAAKVPLSIVTRYEQRHPLSRVVEGYLALDDFPAASRIAEGIVEERFHTRDNAFHLIAVRASERGRFPEAAAAAWKIAELTSRIQALRGVARAQARIKDP